MTTIFDMGYPGPPWPPPPPPQRNAADVTVSIIVMIITVFTGGAGAVMGLFSLAFLDHCPPETCSADAAVTVAMTTVGIAALIALTGLILTIARLGARKRGWPFAVGTLAAMLVVFFLGAMAYTVAVGG